MAIFVDDELKSATSDNLVNILVGYSKENFEKKETNLSHFLSIDIDHKSTD